MNEPELRKEGSPLEERSEMRRGPCKAPIQLPLYKDVNAGKQPFQRDDAKWNKIIEKIGRLYKLGAEWDGTADSLYLALDAAYKFVAKKSDDEFRYLHVEFLLEQAFALLDRVVKDRMTYNDLAAKSFTVGQELEQYYRNDQVHQLEIAAGYYTLPYEQSGPEFFGELEYVNELGQDREVLNQSLPNESQQNKRGNLAQLRSYLGGINECKGGCGKGGYETAIPWDGQDGGSKSKADHLRHVAEEEMKLQFADQMFAASVQDHSLAASIGEACNRLTGLNPKVNWDAKDIDFRRARTQIARDLADKKTIAYTTENGAHLHIQCKWAQLKTGDFP